MRYLIISLLAPWMLLAAWEHALAEPAPESPVQIRPVHDRPFFLPAAERESIKRLVRTQAWARDEYALVQKRATEGDGFWAAFLVALDDDAAQLPAAREYLLKQLGPESYWTPRYRERLNDPEFFKTGTPHLADVYYGLEYQPLIAFDWAFKGLSSEDRKACEAGIRTLAHYRMRTMDRWYQTPNLVFKPTFMVAMAGLTLQDEEMLRWGFFRTEPHGARLGGYFRVLDVMLRDGGPWHEATIYPIAHEDLWCMSILSRYGSLATGRDWFGFVLPRGGSAKGLLDYYLDTAYPIERTGHGAGQVRVATYGDGATSPGGDLFLANPAGDGLNAEKALIAAYSASGDPRYAALVGMTDGYQPDLWNQRPLPDHVSWPPAPSKIWPTYGLAILRSDESPKYWTSENAMAVFQLMSQGYGHDHRDKFAIMLHGAGRLLYPDYNAIQYESSSVGWTRHSCSHSTLIVDEQDTNNAEPTGIRHEFTPEVKYLATSSSGVFEGVDQTRVLMLTAEYLLDVFQARSDLPHTYDYLLHGFGEARATGGDFRPAAEHMTRYWVLEDKRAARIAGPWSLEFVQRDAPGSRGGQYAVPWYEHTARVRVSMAAVPETLVVHGRWGDKYAQMVSQRHQGKKQLDRLSCVVARRADCQETVFVAVHEPAANEQRMRIRGVTQLARTSDAVLVRVDAEDFTDYAAVCFGPQTGTPIHALSDGTTSVAFRDYAYARVFRDGRVVARGDLIGVRLPKAAGPLTLAGQHVSALRGDGALEYLSARVTEPPLIEPRCPLELTLSPKALRVWTRDHKTVEFTVRNPLRQPIGGRIEFRLPEGITAEPGTAEFRDVRPGQETVIPVEFRVFDSVVGKLAIPYRVVYRESQTEEEIRTRWQPMLAYIGPTIEQQFRFPEPAIYRAVTSRYTAALRMSDGAPIYLADDADQVRLNGSPLFLLAEGDGDDRVPMVGEEPQTLGVWVGEQPANLVAEAYGQTEKRSQRCRWQAIFNVSSIMFRMDPDWSRMERARFTIPGDWRCAAGRPRWKRIVTVDERGNERDSQPRAEPQLVSAALLEFPDSPYHLAWRFDPPQSVSFRDAGMEFSIRVVPRDAWFLGFCRSDAFDAWRGK